MSTPQRRRNLEEQLSELETRRDLVEEKINGAGTATLPEWPHELARIERRIIEVEAELAIGSPQTAKDQVSRMWAIVSQLELSVRRLERKFDEWTEDQATAHAARNAVIDRWIIVLLIGMVFAYGLIIAVYSYAAR